MSITRTINNGHSGARSIMVWDPLIRLIHWGLALIILLNATVIDDDGTAHQWLGYIAAGLIVIRIIWGIVGSKYAKFSTFLPNPIAVIRHLKSLFQKSDKVHLSHNPLGSLMAYNIWATVLLLGVTGYMMGIVQFFGVEWVEELHELAFGWLLVSIAFHLAGIAFDTWHTGVPLVGAMIDGRKRIPQGKKVK